MLLAVERNGQHRKLSWNGRKQRVYGTAKVTTYHITGTRCHGGEKGNWCTRKYTASTQSQGAELLDDRPWNQTKGICGILSFPRQSEPPQVTICLYSWTVRRVQLGALWAQVCCVRENTSLPWPYCCLKHGGAGGAHVSHLLRR